MKSFINEYNEYKKESRLIAEERCKSRMNFLGNIKSELQQHFGDVLRLECDEIFAFIDNKEIPVLRLKGEGFQNDFYNTYENFDFNIEDVFGEVGTGIKDLKIKQNKKIKTERLKEKCLHLVDAINGKDINNEEMQDFINHFVKLYWELPEDIFIFQFGYSLEITFRYGYNDYVQVCESKYDGYEVKSNKEATVKG